MVKIRSEKLTTCRVAADGEEVGLEFLDTSGAAVRLEMPVEQAELLIMTLPQLLASALRQKTGDEDARYVFGLGEWAIESAKGQDCLIATLKRRTASRSVSAFHSRPAVRSARICCARRKRTILKNRWRKAADRP